MRYLRKFFAAAVTLLLALTLLAASVSADTYLGEHPYTASLDPKDAVGYTEAAPEEVEEIEPAPEEVEEVPPPVVEPVPTAEPLPTAEPAPTMPPASEPEVKKNRANGWYIVGAAAALGLLCVGAAAISRKKR